MNQNKMTLPLGYSPQTRTFTISLTSDQLQKDRIANILQRQLSVGLEDVILVYLDEDGDEITVDNQDDFQVARDTIVDSLVFKAKINDGVEIKVKQNKDQLKQKEIDTQQIQKTKKESSPASQQCDFPVEVIERILDDQKNQEQKVQKNQQSQLSDEQFKRFKMQMEEFHNAPAAPIEEKSILSENKKKEKKALDDERKRIEKQKKQYLKKLDQAIKKQAKQTELKKKQEEKQKKLEEKLRKQEQKKKIIKKAESSQQSSSNQPNKKKLFSSVLCKGPQQYTSQILANLRANSSGKFDDENEVLTVSRAKLLFKTQLQKIIPEIKKQLICEKVQNDKIPVEGKLCQSCKKKLFVPFYFDTNKKIYICSLCEEKDDSQTMMLKIRSPSNFQQNLFNYGGQIKKQQINCDLEKEGADKFLEQVKNVTIQKVKEQLKIYSNIFKKSVPNKNKKVEDKHKKVQERMEPESVPKIEEF